MPSILLTGGAGFVYSHVARHFVQQGWSVTIADHFDMQGKGQNPADILPSVRLLIGDLATGALAERCAEVHADYIVHAAAYTHVDDAIADPERFTLNNTVATTRLLQALWTAPQSLQRLLIVSTDEVFGPTPPGRLFDEQAPYNPSNAYAASKVGVEAIARAFWHTHKLPLVIMRPSNTYGPNQFPAKVIPKFIRQMPTGGPVTLYNDGQGARDWLHVFDHARAVETLLLHGVPGESYNLGANAERTDYAIFQQIGHILHEAGLLDTVPLPTYVPGRPGHDRRYAMDTTKLRALGWAPQVPFADAFRDTVLWNAEHATWWDHDLVTMGEDTMSVLTVMLPTPLFEHTTGVYTFEVVDENEAGLDGGQLTSLTLTYYDLVTGAILNSREDQDVFNANDVTLTTATGPVATVTWDIRPEDTVLHDSRRETEQHIALFQWTWAAGMKHAAHKVQFGIEALAYTLALP